jgi:hypothetical protein
MRYRQSISRSKETARTATQPRFFEHSRIARQASEEKPAGRILAHRPPGRTSAALKVNEPGDRYEQEADHVAETVMRMSDRDASGTDLQTGRSPERQVERLCDKCVEEEGSLQRQATEENHSIAPPIVHETLHSPGQPLDPATRAFFEPRFGHDFSRVRVHADERAAASSRSVKALAYTVGRDIVFGTGQYAPGTSAGRRILAHELTHVVQQQGAQSLSASPSGVQTSAPPMRGGILQRNEDEDAAAKKAEENKKSVIAAATGCPGFDRAVKSWLYQKAEPYILGHYKPALITGMKSWKDPSSWGEIDMDIYFTKVKGMQPDETVDLTPVGDVMHVKLVAYFEPDGSGGFRVKGGLIEWLDGKPLTMRVWEADVKLVTKERRCTVSITDIAEPARTPREPVPAPPAKDKPPRSKTA